MIQPGIFGAKIFNEPMPMHWYAIPTFNLLDGIGGRCQPSHYLGIAFHRYPNIPGCLNL
jgi:hypothetical protein